MEGSNLTKITSSDMNAQSPQLSPDGKILIFLSNRVGGAHNQCAELVLYDTCLKYLSVIVPVPSSSRYNNDFPGIYADSILPRAFIPINNTWIVLIKSTFRSRQVILAVNLGTAKVVNLCNIDEFSWQLLDVHLDGWIIASQSTLTTPSQLVFSYNYFTLNSFPYFH